jgi:uncharacterized protein (DUF608 family)
MGYRFWDTVTKQGEFDDTDLTEPTERGKTAVCALGARFHLSPGESMEVPFLIAWHFPNYLFGQHDWDDEKPPPPSWPSYYARGFENAWDVVLHVHRNLNRLRGQTLRYHDALFNSTLPPQVLDAASSQTSTLKSPTCLRLEDGTFYGFEGCGPHFGCCLGSCTHVWNYQQALPFLFPSLERSMREADYRYNLREDDGKMAFRIGAPLGTSHWDRHAAADGQLGGIMKLYRDWLLCGNDDWLREIWPAAKKALSYAWEHWDVDRDGVPEGQQHCTYDIELYGPNALIGTFYLGALRAAEEMALYLGEDEQAEAYRDLFETGRRRIDATLFNGEYYEQEYHPAEVEHNQFGCGCLSDQMLGQWLASICGLGYLLEPDKVRATLGSIFAYNWRDDLTGHANPQRVYAGEGEAGLLMASWPRDRRPLIPILYCDEVWTGIEYQVASHLISEGLVKEGLAVVKGARDRHDGRKRNPWDEPECGSHYARAMSSWGLVLALSGYFYNASAGLMQFAPRVSASNFRILWSNDAAWGTFAQKLEDARAQLRLEVAAGAQQLRTLRLQLPAGLGEVRARAEGRDVPCAIGREDGWTLLSFPESATVPAGSTLAIVLTN